MKLRARVLIVSRDETLLKTREMIIGVYFNATEVGRPSEARAMLLAGHFDLVVLCHSVRPEECEYLAALAHRQKPRAKVLTLRSRTDDAAVEPWADEQLGVEDGAFALLIKSAKMLNYRIKSKAGRPILMN